MLHLVIFGVLLTSQQICADYWSDRNQFINEEYKEFLGASINLTTKEQEVNQILMRYKVSEFDAGFDNPKIFAPAVNFFQSKALIEQSELFEILKILPKGASLHSHDTAIASTDYLYQITFNDNIYVCVVNNRLQFRVFDTVNNDDCEWELLSDIRQKNETYNDFVKSQLSIIVPNPFEAYPDINDVWSVTMDTFATVFSLLSYKPFFEEYFYQAFKELYEDNVMYIEFRSILPELYTTDGQMYGPEEVVATFIAVLERFQTDYPEFHGARLIYAPSRRVNNATVDEYITIARNLKAKFPNFLAGFDLVGQEDLGKPLDEFIDKIMELSGEMKFFFHAGETDWNGSPTDLNIIDAILLNSTRIGHGYAITKHPKALRIVKERPIPLEVSPISNQVLKLVDDLRDHPASLLLAESYPIVISCDDPGLWGAKALSYDWYMAFLGMTNREADLRILKQLALNSINYSTMDESEKQQALFKWEKHWNTFLDTVLFKYYYSYNVVEI